MDKLKQYTATLRKHYFWVLCALICIVAVTTWNMSTSDLHAKFETNQRTLKSVFTELTGFNSESPNDKYPNGLTVEQKKLHSQVMDAWVEFKKVQLDKLVWPEKVAAVNQLPANAEIPEQIRENFVTNVVKPNLQRIFEIVNIRRPKDDAANANQGLVLPGMGGGNPATEYIGIVDWDVSKRQDLESRFKMNEIPSTIWCRTKMEDMWIYESLVNIIAKINEGSTDSLNASIKHIEKLDLAQWAIYDSQKNPGAELKLKKPDTSLGGPTPSGQDDGFVRIPGHGEQKIPADMALIDGRYIDENNQPVPAEAAFSGLIDPQAGEGKIFVQQLEKNPGTGGQPRTVKEPPFTEFRQVFVDMEFLMDQRRIPDLLAACANSPLPIEIRQVLMNFYDVDTIKSTDSNQAAAMPGGMGGGMGAVGGAGAMPGANKERAPYDATVQIRGIVYVYNQPDAEKLGKGSAPKPAQRKLGTPLQKTADQGPAMAPAEPQFN